MRYAAIVIDLDGTLLDRAGGVSMENRAAVAAAREAGLHVIVATGRALSESRDALRCIAHEGPVVAAGGALLCDAATGRTDERRVLPAAVVERVTSALLGHEHKVLLLKDAAAAGFDYLAVGSAPLDAASEWWFAHCPAVVRFVERLEDDPCPTETVRVGSVAQGRAMAAIAEGLMRELDGLAHLQHWSAVTEREATGSKTHLLEVFHMGVNKWSMVESYCARIGIDHAAIVAIGDEINDLELIRRAGLGIAMGNAVASVRSAAHRVTDHHHDHGCARAIEHVLAGRW
jgi:hypothetical protein